MLIIVYVKGGLMMFRRDKRFQKITAIIIGILVVAMILTPILSSLR